MHMWRDLYTVFCSFLPWKVPHRLPQLLGCSLYIPVVKFHLIFIGFIIKSNMISKPIVLSVICGGDLYFVRCFLHVSPGLAGVEI